MDNPYELFDKNQRMIYHAISKYYHRYVNDDDVIQEGSLGLWKACLTFKPELGFTFSTYGTRCILNQIGLYFRKENKNYTNLSLDNIINDDGEQFIDLISDDSDTIEDHFLDFSENIFLSNLKPLDAKLYRLLKCGYSQSEIAMEIGLSQPSVSRRIKRVREVYNNLFC